ncbi:MAG: transposase [Ruminococcus sp.]|nr:transposase [Ruminococcus sp.]
MSTVANWHMEIFNYFNNRYTNAQTDSLNNVIREIDRAGRGYIFPMLRAKVLYRHITTKKGKFTFKK